MFDVYKIHLESGIPIGKLRKMEALGYLAGPELSHPSIAEMTYKLKRGNYLTAMQRMHLIENPEWIYLLGHYMHDAEEQLEGLGNAMNEAAPVEAVVAAYGAAKGRSEDVEVLMAWMKSAIPAEQEVTHYYLAVRLLLGDQPNIRHLLFPKIQDAFAKVRFRRAFRDWFSTRLGREGRNATYYHRPKLDFDL